MRQWKVAIKSLVIVEAETVADAIAAAIQQEEAKDVEWIRASEIPLDPLVAGEP